MGKQFLFIAKEDCLQIRLRNLQEITMDIRKTEFLYTSLGKMRFLLQIKATLLQFIQLGFTEKDLDEVKGVLADTNLYLLGATVLIGSIHLLLDFLSFKNDVSFWKSQKSMTELSSHTVYWRAFSQTIIFWCQLDEGMSLLVLMSSGSSFSWASLRKTWMKLKGCSPTLICICCMSLC
ncbi:cleft lip and palate transmembrane protein 1-like protein [Aethina tumida]|uniref:cleft lip and palate transmembrane protein 1-like protein n=1 Tax=Aethina tumida TaxID=116153 RepID=UPI00214864C4|nr:cleft lip and palate transmembrane protein 1-like protein [Aethina tumida]